MQTEVNYEKIYEERYTGVSFADGSRLIDEIEDETEQEELRALLCYNILEEMTVGFTHYQPDIDYFSAPGFLMLAENIEKFQKDWYFLWSVYYLIKKDYNLVLTNIEKLLDSIYQAALIDNPEYPVILNEDSFIYYFFDPFKNAFDGFWHQLAVLLKKYPVGQDVLDYCKLIDQFYTLESGDDLIDVLLQFHLKYPNYRSVMELLGEQYYEKKMWRNAIAYFEKATEDGFCMLLSLMNIYFSTAWCYGKIKDTRQEECYYRKCVEIDREAPFVLNNLGYCLFKQKKYKAAKELFEECLEKKLDLQFAANNYVRVLIALGRNKDAKAFIKKEAFKVQKSLKDKVAKLDDANARIKKDIVVEILEQEEDTTQTKNIDDGVKRQQFSSEKLLEDELTLRLESGMPVFGMNLQIYNHRGDYYGRQYPFEMGRLDLLCEDEKGDLYIIELKKDSGYDDAYVQTAQYLDWFEKAPISRGKNLYGIICLNSPSPELISKVRQDKRMRLFEDQISYTEIK